MKKALLLIPCVLLLSGFGDNTKNYVCPAKDNKAPNLVIGGGKATYNGEVYAYECTEMKEKDAVIYGLTRTSCHPQSKKERVFLKYNTKMDTILKIRYAGEASLPETEGADCRSAVLMGKK